MGWTLHKRSQSTQKGGSEVSRDEEEWEPLLSPSRLPAPLAKRVLGLGTLGGSVGVLQGQHVSLGLGRALAGQVLSCCYGGELRTPHAFLQDPQPETGPPAHRMEWGLQSPGLVTLRTHQRAGQRPQGLRRQRQEERGEQRRHPLGRWAAGGQEGTRAEAGSIAPR